MNRCELRTRRFIAVAGIALLAWAGTVAASDLTLKAWPFLYYAPDEVSQETRFEFLWPLYVRHSTPQYAANQVLSFPQDYPTDYAHQYYFVWPVSGLRLAPTAHDAWLFPLVWSGHDGNRRHAVIFPLLWFFQNANDTALNIGILCHNDWDAYGQGHYLFPLGWTSWGTYPDRTESSSALLPLFWVSRQHGKTWDNRDTWLTLAGWGSDSSEESNGATASSAYHALFPLFWEHHYSTSRPSESRTSSGSSLWLLPHYRSEWQEAWQEKGGAAASRQGTFRATYPLQWDSRETTTGTNPVTEHWQGLLPLYWWHARDTKNKSLFDAWALLYWRHAEAKVPAPPGALKLSHGIFPLWWDFRDTRVAGAAERASYVIPLGAYLYKEGEYETQNLLGPLFTRCDNRKQDYVRYDLLFPLVYVKHGPRVAGGRVLPLAGWEEKQHAYANLWYLFPLGWDYESQPELPAAARDGERWRLDNLESRRAPLSNLCTGAELMRALYPFWWYLRQDGAAQTGVMPFFARDRQTHLPDWRSDSWYWPLALGSTQTSGMNSEYHRQDWLLSALAWGDGPDYRLLRIFPFWSDWKGATYRTTWAWLPPFDFTRSGPLVPDPDDGERLTTTLAIPFSWLPWFKTETATDGKAVTSTTRFFPFVTRTVDTAADKSGLAILWPLFDAEWQHGETRIEGVGGVSNYYERDANGFVDRRFLYRVYRNRTRSWVSEQEFMPFFSRTHRSDGTGRWDFLAGLFGAGQDAGRSYVCLLFLPIPTGAGAAGGDEVTPDRHAEFALAYLKSGRMDRAALEFTLAGNARKDDREFQMQAGLAYLQADASRLEFDLRESVPESLSQFSAKSQYFDSTRITAQFKVLALQRFERVLALGGDPKVVKRYMADCTSDARRLRWLEEIYRQHKGGLGAGLEFAAALTEGSKQDQAKALTFLRELRQTYPRSASVVMALAARELAAKTDAVVGDWKKYEAARDEFLPIYEEAAGYDLLPEEAELFKSMAQPAWWRGREFSALRLACSGEQPVLAANDQACQILLRQLGALPQGGELRTTAANRVERIMRLILRRLTQAGTRKQERDVCDSQLGNLEHTLAHAFQKQDLSDLAIAAYEAALKEPAPAVRSVIESRLKRLLFNRSYLTAWFITPGTGVESPARTAPLQTAAGSERYVDLDRLLGRVDRCTATAECRITSPTARDAVLWLGFDHELTAELNGAVVYGPARCKIASRDEFRVPITLKAGENTLKLTVRDDKLSYGFYARLSDPKGEYMRDVTAGVPP